MLGNEKAMDIIKLPIIPAKGSSWHLYMHPYFTKQASNVVSEYILHYSKEGDTVLDPFSGTGVTAIEALALKRKAIAVDLNPLACFITEQTVVQIDIELFKNEFNKIKRNVGEKIKLYDNLSNVELENIEITYWYPKGIKLPKDTDKGFDFVEQLWTKRQLLGLSTLWHEINKIENIEIQNQMKLVFSATISRVNITYNLSMSRQKGDKINIGDGGAAIFAQYRYWVPKNIIELKVWDNFERRFKLISRGKEKWNEITKGFNVKENFKIINSSVLALDKHITSGEIDYIYTDPPYGGNIAYLDLSTMWNAWLGFEINDKIRNEEIIEGGDLDKTQRNYEDLFSQSFEAMSRVLKKDGWLSLVFAHKKLEFWNLIIDANDENGMEFKGSVYQPTNNSSVHYKKNPASVLCSQRIANFQKTMKKVKREKPDDLRKDIENELERAINSERGASLDVLYQRVLDKLLNNNTIHEAKKRGYLKLESILDNPDLFKFDAISKVYYSIDHKNKNDEYQKEYFQNRNELEIFIKSLLKEKGALTLNEIHKEIFEIYSDEQKFPVDKLHKDLFQILEEIGIKNKSQKWTLNVEQISIDFGKELTSKLIKINTGNATHSETIFRLVQIGKYLKFNSWIGKREQSVDEFLGHKFNALSIQEFPIKNIKDSQENKISQIDVIWFDKLNNPRYAFEVEESTNIMTGLERFAHLLEIDSTLANHSYIIAPKSRTRKVTDVFKNSQYIGHPMYLENKIGLIYKEELYSFYDSHIENNFDEKEIVKLAETLL